MSTRSIWEPKLGRTLTRGDIPESTLRVPICEMDVVELRSHCRWDMLMALVRRSCAPLQPRNTQILDDGVFGEWGHKPDDARLVPGGRYAISKTDEVIKLWDLGPIRALQQEARIQLVDSSEVPEPDQDYFSWISPFSRSTTDTFCFTAIISAENPTVHLYEINQVHGDCKMRILGRLQFPESENKIVPGDVGMTGDLVHVHYQGVQYIWDYRHSLITSLSSPDHTSLDKMFIGNGIGVEINNSAVYGWRVPSFRPLTPDFALNGTQEAPPLFELPIPDDARTGSECHIVAASSGKGALHIAFDIARARHTWGGENQRFDINQLRVVLKADSNAAPTLLRYSETFDIAKPHAESKLTYIYNWVAPGAPVWLQDKAWGVESRNQLIYSTAMEDENEDAPHSAWITIPINNAVRNGVVCNLTPPCPISGRMLLVCREPIGWDGTTSYPRAYILDFYASG
ncbi:hypothetical protein DFP72DRAFT_1047488 [Ephemerocybe angulata]|uniref:Uncharacterized protein n=1 Tax=Ephemerocybe angulata TaxID=980116 RepID=A0A8H6HRG4_9AGAR|nr:hypothetical protein DFP72DRAFT_1047488 [Tulosesus angulatus]